MRLTCACVATRSLQSDSKVAERYNQLDSRIGFGPILELPGRSLWWWLWRARARRLAPGPFKGLSETEKHLRLGTQDPHSGVELLTINLRYNGGSSRFSTHEGAVALKIPVRRERGSGNRASSGAGDS